MKNKENFLKKVESYATKMRETNGFDEMHKLWQQTAIPYDMEPINPHSEAYKDKVLSVYQSLTKQDYELQNEISRANDAVEFEQGFPWCTSNLGVICEESAKVIQCMRALQEADMGGKKIIEFGSGWGNLAIPLAKSGLNVTVIDINVDFLERVERKSKNENVNITKIENDFIGACNNLTEKYDAVIFQSSFHHCIDFHILLHQIKNNVLTSKGKIFFFSEPIFDNYRFPWGIRFDGESLWAVMINKWLELGFDKSFFSSVLLDSGFFLEQIPEVSGYVGNGWRATQYEEKIPFSDWVLPKEFDQTFHAPDSSFGGRFCRSKSSMPALKNDNKIYRLNFRNYSPQPINFTISAGGTTMFHTLKGGDCCVVLSPFSKGDADIFILSEVYYPYELIYGNGDIRELGVFLESVSIQNTEVPPDK